MTAPLTLAFLSEILGTGTLILLGCGLNANLSFRTTKGYGPSWALTTIGWGFAVFAGVFTAFRSGAHLNPAVSLGLLVAGEPFHESVDGSVVIQGSLLVLLVYVAGQLIGAFLGAVGAWLAYKQHYDQADDPEAILGTFATSPATRGFRWNFVSEVIGTFVLVFWVIINGPTPDKLGPLAVAIVVIVIGAGLGGSTGYAINPARDLAPRLAHAVLPIPGKGSSDWGYAWLPIAAPLVGGALAGIAGSVWVGLA